MGGKHFQMSNFQMLFMIISNQLEKKQTQNMTGLPASGTRGVAADSFPPTPTGGGTFQEGSRPQGLQIRSECVLFTQFYQRIPWSIHSANFGGCFSCVQHWWHSSVQSRQARVVLRLSLGLGRWEMHPEQGDSVIKVHDRCKKEDRAESGWWGPHM